MLCLKLKTKKPLNISQFIALVFLSVIVVGTMLLCLPIASRNGQFCGFNKALFTATSSTCVTGLVLADTYTQWSGFGQAVILCLIEIGGLGFVSIASFVVFTLRKKVNMNTQMMIAQTIGSDAISDSIRVQKKVVGACLFIEGIGAAVLTARFCFEYPFLQALKLGVFHSVSAFCNAGFDIFGYKTPNGSVALYGTDPVVILTLSFLIIVGGLGFLVWDEIVRIKEFKKFSVYTKLVLITTFSLLVFGTICLCFSEWNNAKTVGNMNFFQKILGLFFQSVTTRTAGFAGIDQGAMTEGSKAISIFLMLIGGSSGSTAGGLKTVTFVVLVLFVISRLKGRNNITVFYRTIPNKIILNALTIFGAMVGLSFLGATIISVTNGFTFTESLFETVSAIATVGLTTGITPKLNLFSQFLIIIFMYFGRVGILTVSLGFIHNANTQNKIKYAETNLLIG